MAFPAPLLVPAALAAGALAAVAPAPQGPIPYDTQASWESYASGVTTGGAFADLDRDGDLDLVVANGNDMARQRVEVYYNDGLGNFPANPQWQSSDVDYHGHLAVGDVDQDGWPDVAVSVFLGPGGFGDRGHVKLYRNAGGTLTSTPVWRSADTFYTFSCDLGDADGDGDLDLAVATGEPYYDPPDRNRIYYNAGGTLQTSPGWLSGIVDHALDVSFGDADSDGDLDLAFCTAGGPNRIYYQGPSGMSTSAGWASTDRNNQNGNSLVFADTDADGFLELAVSDNNQLSGGQGVWKIYDNSAGVMATTPFWSSYGGYVSAVAFADLHLDGYPDLAGGIWWGGARIFANNAGSFPSSRSWQSSKLSVVEAIGFGDADGNGLRTTTESHAGNGVMRTFYLDRAPIHTLLELRADGQLLTPADYCFDADDGWIALDRAPALLEVTYRWSESLDIAVTNWDTSIGNLLFLRHDLVRVDAVPTGPTTLQRGDWLRFDVTLTSTVNRSESFVLAIAAQSAAGGPYRLLGTYPKSLAPFQSTTSPYAFQVPPNTPPSFNGPYSLVAAALRTRSEILGSDSFPFVLQ